MQESTMNTKRQALRWLWTLCAFLVLLVTLVAYDGTPNSDAEILLGYAMLALSFPSGLIIAIAYGLLGRVIYAVSGHVFTTSYASIIVVWLIFSIAGYLQWFVLLPLLWRRLKARREGGATPTG
jgi:hypothetical protein